MSTLRRDDERVLAINAEITDGVSLTFVQRMKIFVYVYYALLAEVADSEEEKQRAEAGKKRNANALKNASKKQNVAQELLSRADNLVRSESHQNKEHYDNHY